MNQINLEAYYRTIEKKTGKKPDDFKALAKTKGYFENDTFKPEIKAAEVIAWLKQDFGLGHGHSLALYHYFKD